MRLNILKKRKNFGKKKIIDPEQTFIDTKNLPAFDRDKFEGVIEKPLGLFSLYGLLSIIFLIFIIFIINSFNLQIVNGASYLKKSNRNYLKKEVLFSERGVILDRNNIPLAWNITDDNLEFPKRKYIEKEGFSHLLGFLSYPQKDKSDKYFEKEYVGKAGVEKYFNDKLNGKLGNRIFKVDALGNILSDNIISKPEEGQNIKLTIDAKLQEGLQLAIKKYIEERKFNGGAGIIMDVRNGEILAMTSLPEYDSNILTEGKNKQQISIYNNDKNHPFLNKDVYAEFTPGSIMKPFIALAALEEKIVTPYQKIYTNGKLIIPNPWHPSNPSIFYDWKNHGVVNLFSAIANSSNIYFYKIGGGFEKMKGLGIDKIYKYLTEFGFEKKTKIEGFPEKNGNVPNRKWKKKVFGRDWTIGNTYYTSIGQYGFLVTPIQMIVGTAMIANNGKILQPKIIFQEDMKPNIIKDIENINIKNFSAVKKAMRTTVLSGTTQSLNLPFVKIASKSGTAQIKNRTRENSWVIGFWPYTNPKYAFVLLAEDGPKTTVSGVSRAASDFFKWMNENGLKKYFK